MSSTIWTQCAGSSEIRALATTPWRVVEAQHQIATRKLVDSDAEQVLLEEVLERHKPPLADGGRLHYLLFTPFRYPPLPHGSRFASRHEPGVWYGSESLRTAFAEVAYYRLLFLEGTRAALAPLETDLSAFTIRVKTARGVDLTGPPFARVQKTLASRSSYVATQALGTAMRDAAVEAFRYASARDVRGGVNVGVFSPRAFAGRRPRRIENWHCVAARDHVEIAKRDYFERVVHRYPRAEFLVQGTLPSPAA
jgi:RES domain-containing protein